MNLRHAYIIHYTVAYLMRKGVALKEFTDILEIEEIEFISSNQSVDLPTLDRLMAKAKELSGDPYLGLSVGSNIHVNELQIFHPFLLGCPNLGMMATHLAAFVNAVNTYVNVDLAHEQSVPYIEYNPGVMWQIDYPETAKMVAELELILLVQLIRQATGQNPIVQLHFRSLYDFQASSHYESVLHIPVHFGKEYNRIYLHTRAPHLSIQTYQKAYHGVPEGHIQQIKLDVGRSH